MPVSMLAPKLLCSAGARQGLFEHACPPSKPGHPSTPDVWRFEQAGDAPARPQHRTGGRHLGAQADELPAQVGERVARDRDLHALRLVQQRLLAPDQLHRRRLRGESGSENPSLRVSNICLCPHGTAIPHRGRLRRNVVCLRSGFVTPPRRMAPPFFGHQPGQQQHRVPSCTQPQQRQQRVGIRLRQPVPAPEPQLALRPACGRAQRGVGRTGARQTCVIASCRISNSRDSMARSMSGTRSRTCALVPASTTAAACMGVESPHPLHASHQTHSC